MCTHTHRLDRNKLRSCNKKATNQTNKEKNPKIETNEIANNRNE